MHHWVDFFLHLVISTNLAWSLHAARWSQGLERLFIVAIFATVAATVVARSGFRRFFALLYSLVVGASAVLFAVAALAPAELVAQQRVYHMLGRASGWLVNAFRGQPAVDALMFVFVLAVLIYILSYSAAWTYFRDGRKWQALLPIGLAMLVNLYYAPPRLGIYFVVYLLCAILLAVRATLRERQGEWQAGQVYFPNDIGFDFTRDGILFALFVILVAWVLPTSADQGRFNPLLDPLQDPWRQFQQEWNRLFSTLNYTRTTPGANFGTSLSLGGPRTVDDGLVMDVETPVNRYYRAVVLDTYLPGGWVLQNAPAWRLRDDAILPVWEARQEVTQTITTYYGGNVLMGAPQPVAASLPSDVRALPQRPPSQLAETPPSSDEPVELAMLIARASLQPGDSYVVRSSIPVVSQVQLRDDQTSYPDYISERYLQLPETVPQRVFDLAEQVATGSTNAYDAAKAIETFLRGYRYNDRIEGPQAGQDGVDYFLFDEKQGYCNYYASAMAVMLRHLGIPARIAAGYATGEYIEESAVYRVRNRDAHTWVEVFFPTYGWVEFEPTASEPVLERPVGEIIVAPPPLPSADGFNEDPLLDVDPTNPGDLGSLPPSAADASPLLALGPGGGLALMLAAIAGLLALAFWTIRRLQQPAASLRRPVFQVVPEGFAARLWANLMLWARRLGLLVQPSQTPLEQAGNFGDLLPEGAGDLGAIATLYTRDLYSPHPLTPAEAADGQLAWLRLLPLLRRRWLDHKTRLPAGLKRAFFRG